MSPHAKTASNADSTEPSRNLDKLLKSMNATSKIADGFDPLHDFQNGSHS